jgi:hypothetical protein
MELRGQFKNGIVEGGLNITDGECLNKSLKLRQFVRANRSKHSIKMIKDILWNRWATTALYSRNVIK